MWMGSYNGLHKHEGSRIRIYSHTGNDSTSLSNGEMHALFQDRDGFMWVGTTAGLDRLNTVTGKVEHVKLAEPKTHSAYIGYIYNITQDKDGNIWAATDIGFFVINYNTLAYTLLKGNNNNSSVDIICNVTSKGSLATANGIWYNTTMAGMLFYDYATRQFYSRYNNPERKKIFTLGYGNNSDIYADGSNNIYFISNDSLLIRYNSVTEKIEEYPFHFPVNAWRLCMSLYGDDKGNIWIGFRQGGLLVFNSSSHQFTAYRSNAVNSILNSDYVVAISRDYLNNMWVTTDNGAAVVNLYDQSVKEVYLSSKPEMMQMRFNAGVTSIDAEDNIYIPFYRHNAFVYNTRLQKMFEYNRKDINSIAFILPGQDSANAHAAMPANAVHTKAIDATLAINRLNKIITANPGIIVWGCKLSNNALLVKKPGILYYQRANMPLIVLPTDGYLKQLCFSKDPSFLWYIGGDLNLIKFNLATTKADTVFLGPLLEKQHFFLAFPRDLVEDSLHNIWITSQNGLLKYNALTKSLTSFTTANGLAHSFTFALNCDRHNRLWVASLGGIDYYDREKDIFRAVYTSPADKYMEAFGSAVTSAAGDIYFLFGNRLVQINPDSILNQQAKSKPFFISQVLVNGEQYTVTNFASTHVFSYLQNRFTFQFGVLDFNPNKINYSYYLKGLDKGWIDNGRRSELSFNSLPPGDYVLNVKAVSNSIGDGESQLQFKFTIGKAFWQTWWFVTIIAMVCFFIAFMAIKWRIGKIKAIAAEKLKVQQLNAEQYKNQLELEQIINYFSSSLIDKNTVEEVLWDVAKNLIGRLGFKDCVLYLWNDTKTKLIQRAGYGSKASVEDLENKYFEVLPGQGIVGFVAKTKEALLIPDTSKDARYRSDDEVRLSEIAVPVIYNNELIGVIDSEHDEKNFFTQQHLQILNTIATLIATKIRSVEAEQLLQHTRLEVFSMNEKLSRARLEALRSQMNPHFIFNSLNAIQECIVTGKVDAAYEYLSKFSKLQRLVLHNSEKEFVSLTSEIEMLQLYLSLEALRFNQSFAYTIEIEEGMDADEIFIPSLITQPYVENAVWHGLRNQEGAQILQISCKETLNGLVIEIDDNGVGRKKATLIKEQKLGTSKFASKGTILAAERITVLNEQHKTNIQVTVIDKTGANGDSEGTRVIIALPADFDKYSGEMAL